MTEEKLSVAINACDFNSDRPTQKISESDVRLYQNISYLLLLLFKEIFNMNGKIEVNPIKVMMNIGKVTTTFRLIYKELKETYDE